MLHRETHLTAPGGRAFMLRSWSAYVNVNPDLLRRLSKLECVVYWQSSPDMRAAVRDAAREAHEQRLEERKRLARQWLKKRDPVRRQNKMYVVNRAAVLAANPNCTYCGDPAITADHIIPRNQGGTHQRPNLVSACQPCNSEKSGRTPDQWREWRLSQGRPWPPLSRRRGA